MADNLTLQSNGAMPGTTPLRTRDISGAGHASKADIAAWVATPVSGGQYALSVSSSSSSTLTVPSTATHAFISVDPGATSIRWTRDGTTPTSTIGHVLVAGDAIELDNLSGIKLIALTSSSTIQVSYHKYV